jgi:hypothetical protein
LNANNEKRGDGQKFDGIVVLEGSKTGFIPPFLKFRGRWRGESKWLHGKMGFPNPLRPRWRGKANDFVFGVLVFFLSRSPYLSFSLHLSATTTPPISFSSFSPETLSLVSLSQLPPASK